MTLTISTSVLILTAVKLHQHKQTTSSTIGANTVDIAPLVLKLVVLFGAAEILGFIQYPNPESNNDYILNAIFKIIYCIVRSFRGVFIFFAFVIRRSVIKNVKQTCSRGLKTRKTTLETIAEPPSESKV